MLVVRLLGTSPDSNNVRSLLLSLLQQLSFLYNRSLDLLKVEGVMDVLSDYFIEVATTWPSAEQPLTIVLDAIDQLTDDDEGRACSWLPKVWANPNLHVVISTLTTVGPTFAKLSAAVPAVVSADGVGASTNSTTDNGRKWWMEVPALEPQEVDSILAAWMTADKKKFTEPQLEYLVKMAKQVLSPLYLRLAYDHASQNWHSFTSMQDITSSSSSSLLSLGSSVSDLIHRLFARLEQRHGKILVSRALGYITCSGPAGLTPVELEDVLSCDDEVLDEVYQWWAPPMRRLPPFIWTRIAMQLSPYLLERGADGALVYQWCHRQFREVAEKRFLDNDCWDKVMSLVVRVGSHWPDRHRVSVTCDKMMCNV